MKEINEYTIYLKQFGIYDINATPISVEDLLSRIKSSNDRVYVANNQVLKTKRQLNNIIKDGNGNQIQVTEIMKMRGGIHDFYY